MLIKNGQRNIMIRCILTELLQSKVREKCSCQNFFGTLRRNNFETMHQIIVILWPFLIDIQCTIGLSKLIFERASSIFTLSEAALLASDFMACILDATNNWHDHYRFSHWRCNIDSLKCKNNFLIRRSGTDPRTKVFGSRANKVYQREFSSLRAKNERWLENCPNTNDFVEGVWGHIPPEIF